MRHSRSTQFEKALRLVETPRPGQRWQDNDADPNAPAALAARAEVLRRAWRESATDRVGFLVERCRGRTVLDIGCVAHDAARMRSPEWLHGRLAAVSRRCVGVDVLEAEVAEMRELGFIAFAHDVSTGLGPASDEAPFDVIVAGELIH